MQKKVFTNGCFDIIHPGHVDLLERAKSLGTKLIVGINSDSSVKKIKGFERPFTDQESRKAVLLGLKAVDEVYIFDELTPENLIKQIRPDVLVKGGDWKIEEIIGADYVAKNGGEVYSLPLKGNFSSTAVIEKIKSANQSEINANLKKATSESNSTIESSLKQHAEVFEKVLTGQLASIKDAADLIGQTFEQGNKLLLCGNGRAAAADAQQLAAKFVGLHETERGASPALALTNDTSPLTALVDDDDFEMIFARQVETLANEGDCLIAICAVGDSPDVIAAMMTARRKKCRIIGLTGAKGKKLASLCDVCVLVPSESDDRIQEINIAVGNVWCETIERKFGLN